MLNSYYLHPLFEYVFLKNLIALYQDVAFTNKSNSVMYAETVFPQIHRRLRDI